MVPQSEDSHRSPGYPNIRQDDPWKTNLPLMVAVGPGPYSEQLIRWTRRIAATMEAPWLAVHVQTGRPALLDDETSLMKNILIAQELGATLITATGDDIARALLQVARQHHVNQIVVGKSRANPVYDLLHGGSLVGRLLRESGDIDIYVIQGDSEIIMSRRPRRCGIGASPIRHYLVSVCAIIIAAIGCALSEKILDYRAIGMCFLFLISLLSLFVGRGPVLVAALFSAAIWNFLFIPPLFTLSISNPTDLFLVMLYFIVALVAGTLTSRIRARDLDVRRRERHSAVLSALVNDLSSADSVDAVIAAGIANIDTLFESKSICFLAGADGRIATVPHPAGTAIPDSPEEWRAAENAFKNRVPSGASEAGPFAVKTTYYPLLSHTMCSGVIGVVRTSGRIGSPENVRLLCMFVYQIALALERIQLRAERLNKILLNSISHELRTPLATITSATSALVNQGTADKPKVHAQLIGDISAAAIRLNRLVDNFLDMTRLESGGVKISKEWCDVADLFQGVLHNLDAELRDRPVTVDIPADMPLVKLDSVLIEQALANIVLNAVFYTPEHAGIRLRAGCEGEVLVFTIEDEGPGFPPESIGRIFDKFYRLPGTKAGGTGLGLSIVKGFVEAHGGAIEAGNRDAGGARFIIRLPVTQKKLTPEEVQ
jgi:two-component system sensor histidine kinase KdpD